VIFDLDHWQEIWHALRANRLRTALTAFGVFWGVFMLVVMVGAGRGLANGVYAEFSETATNGFFVWTERTSKPYRGLPEGRWLRMDNDDVRALERLVPEAEAICPRNQLGGFRGGNNVTRGTRAGAFSVTGDVPEIRRIQRVHVDRGRFLNRLDLDERRKVAVIGSRVVEVLFASEQPIGEYVRINGIYFQVVGTFTTDASGDDAEEQTQTIYVPFTTFQHAFNYGDRVGWFAITSRPDLPASVAEQRVLRVLKERHRVAPDDERAFGHYNVEQEFRKVEGLFTGIGALIWIVGSGTLAAGVIGVSNIMLVIVRERTKEIGIRRAVGAPPWSIMGQIMVEAVVLTAIAGYLGLILGMLGMDGVALLLDRAGGDAEFFRNPRVDLSTAVRALVVLVVSGTLAGVIPAQRALSVRPVEALRMDT
jgi:putative ABC transport system permease protein